ncbi:hypothetical protein [Streptomyces xinghaiensis]|uniref:hypothetical protein n=1 Tax=Streptomyces xinghaiensis TaxID=1038928 RepID=UPI002E141F80|nr:hypothetical protein OG463_25885 [Streptomyces xinghaiensis]
MNANVNTGAEAKTPPRPEAAVARGGSRRWMWLGALVAALALLGGTFTYFNTNAFAEDRLCHGWLSTDEARDVLGGSLGRLSARDDSPWWCTVERSGWFPGADEGRLTLRVQLEAEDFPFQRGLWKVSGDMHISAGAGPGAYDAWSGWTLLPDACTSELRAPAWAGGETPVIFGSVTEKTSPLAMARLLNSAAGTIAGSTLCGTQVEHETGGGDRVDTPSATARTDFGDVCGIPGFKLGKVSGPRGEEVQEQTSGTLNSTGTDWVCDLSFKNDGKNGPFTHLAVVQSPRLVAALKNRGFERTQCNGREVVFAHDDLSYPWDPKERAATGMPDVREMSELFATAAKKALGCAT